MSSKIPVYVGGRSTPTPSRDDQSDKLSDAPETSRLTTSPAIMLEVDQETKVADLQKAKTDLSERVYELETIAKDDQRQRELLQKELDQLKSDKKKQLYKLESELQLQEVDINDLRDEKAMLSKQLREAQDQAKDAQVALEKAQQDTEQAEDAYRDLQMQKDHEELSRKYGANDAESVIERLRSLETVIEDQAAQIHRLEIDLEEMDFLQETNQNLEDENRKLNEDGQRWKDQSQKTAEDNEALEESIQRLEDDNQRLEDDLRISKVNSQKQDEEVQRLKTALEKDDQITAGSGVDDTTMQWVLQARDQTLQLERDLDSLEAAWYSGEGGEAPSRPVSAPPTSVPQQETQERDSDLKSFEKSRQSSEIGEPLTLTEVWVRQSASYAPSAGLQSWHNFQSQPGTRPGSRSGRDAIHTPSQRSRPNSLISLSKPLPSAQFGPVSRGTDAPSRRPNRLSLQSRRSSISLFRTTSSNAVPTMDDLKEKRAKDHFHAYFPHLPQGEVPFFQVPSPEAPKPPSAAQYHPGMASRDFAVEAAQSSQNSLAFYKHNGVQIMEETRPPVRPLHRGRKASLSTISERSGSIFSPRRSESRIRAWLTDDEIRIIRSTNMCEMCERATQTELGDTSAHHGRDDELDRTLVSTSVGLDHSTQTEPLPLASLDPVLTHDRETQTAWEDTLKAVIHGQPAQPEPETILDSEPPLTSSESHHIISMQGKAQPSPERVSAQPLDVRTATMVPEVQIGGSAVSSSLPYPMADKATAMTPQNMTFEDKPVQTDLVSIAKLQPELVEQGQAVQATKSPQNADRATAMTPKDATFEHGSFQTKGTLVFSAADRGMQTDVMNLAELPAAVPTALSYQQASTSRPVSAEAMPRTPDSRVAATARLFEKDNNDSKGIGKKLAILTSRGTQSPAGKESSKLTTPTKLFTVSPHTPFARNEAVTRSLRPTLEAKQIESGESQVVQHGDTALRAKEIATTLDTLPAKVYQGEGSLTKQAKPLTLDAGVQTSTTVAQEDTAPTPEPSRDKLFDPQSDSNLDPSEISPASTVAWETPDDNPYPTPGFYTNPWRSPITPDYNGLEVVSGVSLHDSDKVLVVADDESGHEAEPHPSAVKEVMPVPPEDFARTAMPSPGEVGYESDESDDDYQSQPGPERRQSDDLSQISAISEPSGSVVQDPVKSPTLSTTCPDPVEAPILEVIPAVKRSTHISRPSTSPVSPEDAWQLQVVQKGGSKVLPGPEPRLVNRAVGNERDPPALELEGSRTIKPMIRPLMLPHAGTPGLLQSPIVPFPAFDDQLFESPAEYTHSPYLSHTDPRMPATSEINTNKEGPSTQLWQPPHRPPPLDILRSKKVAENVTPPIDSPYASDALQHDKKRFRFQALAALEGMADRLDYTVDRGAAPPDRGSMPVSVQSSMGTLAGSSARPSPLRFGNNRLAQPELQASSISEIGATSPTTLDVPPLTCFSKPASSIQQRRHKKASSLPATANPVIVGLLEWHQTPVVLESDQTPQSHEGLAETSGATTEEHADPPCWKDKSTNTPTIPGGFRTPPALDVQDFDHLPLPILPLLFAQMPQLLRDAKNIKWQVTIDWSKLWWTVLWLAMAAYFIFNFWLSMLLRDHIDDWKSANVSSRKYNHIVMARDEYWGNSWWRLIEFWLAGGLSGSMELLV